MLPLSIINMLSTMKKYIWMLCSLCTLWACNDKEEPTVQEDYDQLFPFTGVDKPTPQFGQIVERQGDINMTAKTFQYLGTKSDLFQTEYEVTLTYALWEPYNDEGKVKSRIALRFVNEDEQLVSIGSDKDRRYMTVDEYDNWDTSQPYPPIKYQMRDNGRDTSIKFNVKSGFQLLLCLTGNAPTRAWVRAEIVAKALDGSYPPIKITANKEVQGGEGQASIPNALCKYIILP